MSANTLRKVTAGDLASLRECVDTAICFYIVYCDKIALLADYFIDSESGMFSEILKMGLAEMTKRMDILKKMDMKRGDEL